MSQLSPQDLQSLQQLIGVIAPKIIERLKACEATVVSMAGDIDDLQKQVAALHTVAPKAEKREKVKRGSKKKELEVPQLLPGSETATPGVPPVQTQTDSGEVTDVDPLGLMEDPRHRTGSGVPVPPSMTGSPDVGTAAVTPSDASETGGPLSAPVQDNQHGAGTPNNVVGDDVPPPMMFPVVNGVEITGQMVYGVQYIMQQGFTDPVVIAQALQLPPPVVQAIMDMPIAEQAAIMKLAQQGDAA